MSLTRLFASSRSPSQRAFDAGLPNPFYEFEAADIKHKPFHFSELKGKVVLIVNVASQCGFTPQYAGLQALYDKYKDKGLEILGFPCNQFGNQEFSDNSEIETFCSRNYNVTFRIFERIDVNGAKAHPLYQYLKEERPGILGIGMIKWNFEKFLIDREGKMVQRYASVSTPDSIEADIIKLL